MLGKGSNFLEESIKLGEELADKGGLEFIPRFDGSFVESRSDNTVDSPHGFIINWIVSFKNIKKATEIVDIKNGKIDNSWLCWSFVSSFEWDSPVSLTKSTIKGSFRLGEGQSATHILKCAAYLGYVSGNIINAEEKCDALSGKTDALCVLSDFIYFGGKCDTQGIIIEQKVKVNQKERILEHKRIFQIFYRVDGGELFENYGNLWFIVINNPFWKNHAMVGASHVAYTDRFHELARLAPHLVTPVSRMIEMYVYGLAPQIHKMVAATKPKTLQKVVQISGALIDADVENGSIKKVKKKNVGEPIKDKNGKDDNKRTRTENVFDTTVNPVGRKNTDGWPKCTTCNSYHAPGGPCRTCFNCNRPGNLEKDCRGVPSNVNLVNVRNLTVRACYECGSTDHVRSACPRLNRAQGPKENRQNQVVANNGGQGRRNQGNQATGRAFMLGAMEARQDPNIVTGTFTLNDHFATILFDSGADYSFVSTTFIPLLGIELNELGFRYEIKIASGQLVEIDKVIKSCKLEIEGHVFDIDLIPFGHGSFDVIIVRIPLPDGKVLRVLGERPEEKVRLLVSAKASDKKQEEIVVVRDFTEVFPDDLSGLPHVQEIEFRIELIPRVVPIAKSPYRLTPSELEELSGQLKELQDKGFI
nr:hypothetical protein [Tanacetum cinerariifolium]